ncbi:hypothetical protein HK096_009305, partial [Nowakowskiella sp. JEL0078]
MPQPHTFEYRVIMKTLMLALSEDDEQSLRFEAANLLISLKGHRKALSRWDRINFQNTLEEMLQHGVENEKFLAAATCCEFGKINEDIIDVILSRLGDLDDFIRLQCLYCLSLPILQNTQSLFSKLIDLSRNTSWKIREDIVELLTRWVENFDKSLEISKDIEINSAEDDKKILTM